MSQTLSPTIILPQPPWAQDAVLGRVLAALNPATGAPETLIVGGAVRNAIMGRDVADYDLATQLTPDQVIAQATATGMKAVPTGIDHGTVTVVHDGRGFEVTTLRRDIETDGRRAVVAFTDDWRVDAARRDFTMNTLLADFVGHIYDPLGSGLDDARAGHVRFVGDAAERIAEDYLRLLRFFRFHAHYGSGMPDAAAVAACAAAAPHLSGLSSERITQEIMKWMNAQDPAPTIKIANNHKILPAIFGISIDDIALARIVSLQQKCGEPDVMSRLLAMLGGAPEPVVNSLVLSGRQRSFIEALAATKLEGAHDTKSLQRDAARFGLDVVTQRALLDGCNDISGLQGWSVPEFPLTGHDLMRAGMAQGAELGARLSSARERWIASDFTLTKDELITAT